MGRKDEDDDTWEPVLTQSLSDLLAFDGRDVPFMPTLDMANVVRHAPVIGTPISTTTYSSPVSNSCISPAYEKALGLRKSPLRQIQVQKSPNKTPTSRRGPSKALSVLSFLQIEDAMLGNNGRKVASTDKQRTDAGANMNNGEDDPKSVQTIVQPPSIASVAAASGFSMLPNGDFFFEAGKAVTGAGTWLASNLAWFDPNLVWEHFGVSSEEQDCVVEEQMDCVEEQFRVNTAVNAVVNAALIPDDTEVHTRKGLTDIEVDENYTDHGHYAESGYYTEGEHEEDRMTNFSSPSDDHVPVLLEQENYEPQVVDKFNVKTTVSSMRAERPTGHTERADVTDTVRSIQSVGCMISNSKQAEVLVDDDKFMINRFASHDDKFMMSSGKSGGNINETIHSIRSTCSITPGNGNNGTTVNKCTPTSSSRRKAATSRSVTNESAYVDGVKPLCFFEFVGVATSNEGTTTSTSKDETTIFL